MKRALVAVVFALSFLPAAVADEFPLVHSVDFHPNPAFNPLPPSFFHDEAQGAVEQVGEVVILEGDHQLVAEDDNGVLAITSAEMQAITNRFFTRYPDEFEEVAVFVTFNDRGSPNALAYEL